MLFVTVHFSNKMQLLLALPRLMGLKNYLFGICAALFASFNKIDANMSLVHNFKLLTNS